MKGNIMYKHRYKIIGVVIILEYVILSLMIDYNVQIKSIWGNGVVAILFCIPFEMLFFALSKDKKVLKIWRLLFKGIFWFWIFCYLCGLIVKIVGI